MRDQNIAAGDDSPSLRPPSDYSWRRRYGKTVAHTPKMVRDPKMVAYTPKTVLRTCKRTGAKGQHLLEDMSLRQV